ncbi:MAG TPA: hypothetical protein VEX62_06600 [Candidatus Limnocylindrales bacterium]|nr:hypothetical protein [Candidatus Limnocylindrales bacterium]
MRGIGSVVAFGVFGLIVFALTSMASQEFWARQDACRMRHCAYSTVPDVALAAGYAAAGLALLIVVMLLANLVLMQRGRDSAPVNGDLSRED